MDTNLENRITLPENHFVCIGQYQHQLKSTI